MRFLLTCAIALPLFAQTPQSALPVDPMAPNSGSTAGWVYNATPFVQAGVSGAVEVVPAESAPFAKAHRLTTKNMPPGPDSAVEYRVRVRWYGQIPVKAGDLVVARFSARCASSPDGRCLARFMVEKPTFPYNRVISYLFQAGSEWKQFTVPFRIPDDYDPLGYTLDFRSAIQVQAIDIGGFSATLYGTAPLADAGLTELYPGAATDASWRASAQERIEKFRKGDLTVNVLDAAGNPVVGAEVSAKMIRHAFPFGVSVGGRTLIEESEEREPYRRVIKENFNYATLDGDLNWPNWEDDKTLALNSIAWLQESGIKDVKGHSIVWPNFIRMPKSINLLIYEKEAFRQRVVEHISDIVHGVKGQLAAWDVVNDPFYSHDALDLLGNDEMAVWFTKTREIDSQPRLIFNDNGFLDGNGQNYLHQEYALNLLKRFDELKAPVDAIGMQAHFDGPTPPETLISVLDRFAATGKPIEITEYEFAYKDDELQAAYLRDALTAFFSHPAVRSFTLWGFWEGRTATGQSPWTGAFFKFDWTPRPAWNVFRDLVYKQWWTDQSGATAEDGTFKTRGFLGSYELQIKVGEQTITKPVTLGPDGTAIEVRLE